MSRKNIFDFSLKNLCLIRVVCQVAEAVERRQHVGDQPLESSIVDQYALRKTAEDMKDVIQTLDLPTGVKHSLKGIVLPIAKEILLWYSISPHGKPTWMSLGTVDLATSIKDCLENGNALSSTQRFALASIGCHEELIFQIAKESRVTESKWMTSVSTWCPYQGPKNLPEFWLYACESMDREQFDGQCLPNRIYLDGFVTAANSPDVCGRDFALSYFMDKLPREEMAYCCTDDVFSLLICNDKAITAKTLFKFFSKLSNDQIEENGSTLVELLFLTLLNFPFQPFFLGVVRSDFKRLPVDVFWRIMLKILKRLVSGYKDHDYVTLFTECWELGSNLRQGLSISLTRMTGTPYYVLSNMDAHLVELFLGILSIEEKVIFLLDYDPFNISSALLLSIDFKLLELIMRGCEAHRMNNFKKAIMMMRKSLEWSPFEKPSCDILPHQLDRLAKMVDKNLADIAISEAPVPQGFKMIFQK